MTTPPGPRQRQMRRPRPGTIPPPTGTRFVRCDELDGNVTYIPTNTDPDPASTPILSIYVAPSRFRRRRLIMEIAVPPEVMSVVSFRLNDGSGWTRARDFARG